MATPRAPGVVTPAPLVPLSTASAILQAMAQFVTPGAAIVVIPGRCTLRRDRNVGATAA